MKATHKISAVFFPGKREVELTWEDIATGRTASLCAKVTMEEGQQLANVVMPCVYMGAVVSSQSARCGKCFKRDQP